MRELGDWLGSAREKPGFKRNAEETLLYPLVPSLSRLRSLLLDPLRILSRRLDAMPASLHSRMSLRTSTAFSFIEGNSVYEFVHSFDGLNIDERETGKKCSGQSQATKHPEMHAYYQPTGWQSPSEVSKKRIQLQKSNVRLLELLQSIQEELDTQHKLMRDIRNESYNNTLVTTTDDCVNTPTPSSLQACSKSQNTGLEVLSLESREWRKACENFAQNCETTFNPIEPPHRPESLSVLGFDFNFTNKNVPTAFATFSTPTPQLSDVPGLTSESDDDEEPCMATALWSPGEPITTRTRVLTLPADDIMEHVVEFSHFMIARPPRLQSPPRSSKSKSSGLVTEEPDEEITALPQMPAQASTPAVSVKKHGHHRKIKSLFTVKTLLKGRCLGKEVEYRSKSMPIYP